jgi:hypothetical protein
MSKVAYVELINDKNKPVLQAKIELQESCGMGSFQMPADLVTGNYKIRAYTNWMKNFSPNFFFEKEVSIVNVYHFTGRDSTRQKTVYRINLFRGR